MEAKADWTQHALLTHRGLLQRALSKYLVQVAGPNGFNKIS